MIKYYRFSGLLLEEGWLAPAYVGVNAEGTITYLSQESPAEAVATETILGYVLPGFQNAHSHAFQYAMAGLAETHAPGTDDDFWSWREKMYQVALTAGPDEAEAIAAMLYAEMLRVGYTQVAEFHYLHHDPDGKPYTNLAELGERMVKAAQKAGIRITLIPVFYQRGGFGLDPQPRQRRFISRSVDHYFRLLDSSRLAVSHYPQALLGVSVHSLRAVELHDIQSTLQMAPADLPFHIHVAEQKKEIDDCVAYCGSRPMQWMLDHAPLTGRFHLVHSTHLDDSELRRLAATGANVVLCPSTEGNLGDGIFRMKEYAQLGGHWSIGTDSHIGLNPFEELRMIDYRQRLVTNKRNTFPGDAARYMVQEAATRGRLAMGRKNENHFAIGQSFDGLVVSATSHLLADTSEANRMATIVFTSDSSRNIGTIVAGRWVVKDQHHVNRHAIKTEFAKAMKKLTIR